MEVIKRILIVDDEPEFVKTIRRHLRREGFVPESACDGKDARQKISDAARNGVPYDLVITDVIMPDVGGMELLKWIKENYPEISVVVTSGFGVTETMLETMRPELDDWCQKPLTPKRMMRLISGADRRLRIRRY